MQPTTARFGRTYPLMRNFLLLFSVPPGVTTVTNPVVAPVGTVAFIQVSDITVKLAGVPLKQTVVVPFKL
jgi:hypothetical protein